MTREPLWYIAYTKKQWEKKVADLLDKKGIEQYCPFRKVANDLSNHKKLVEVPLFKSYVFVKATEEDLVKVKQVQGIISIVHWLGRPAVIRDNEIIAIRHLLSSYYDVKLEKIKVNLNDTVKVVNTPVATAQDKKAEVANNTIKVILPSLGYVMMAKLGKTNIERIIVRSVEKPASSDGVKDVWAI